MGVNPTPTSDTGENAYLVFSPVIVVFFIALSISQFEGY
jgi:hypothetical protein